ncbi:MAG: response regulator transcription factor [Candidatus Acidiferrales bacterium]
MLADDHEVLRHCIRSLLESQDNWIVCGEAGNGRVAIERAKELKPDLVILDIAMPLVNGFEAARAIKDFLPDTAILAYTVLQSEGFLNEWQRIGFDGYVSKSDGSRKLLNAIREVQRRRSRPEMH